MLAWLRTRRALLREIDDLKHRLATREDDVAAISEQRDTFRDALQALRWESIAYGAAHKTDVERLRAGNP